MSTKGSFDRYWYAWAMVLPVLAVLALVVGYPLGRGVWLSLTDATEANMGGTYGVNEIPATYGFVGLENYRDTLSGAEGNFYPRLGWTVLWTVSCVTLHYGIGLLLATLLNRPMRMRAMYRVLLILPWAVPMFVSAFTWRLMFNSEAGVVNTILVSVGIDAVNWLGDPVLQKISVIIVNVWMGVPFMMLALLGGLQSIPRELHESAQLDGASAWQRFRNVTVPGLRPVSSTVVLLGTIWTFNMFPVIYLVIGQNAGEGTDILATYAFELAFSDVRDYAMAATYGVVILSMLLIFATGYRRILARQEGVS